MLALIKVILNILQDLFMFITSTILHHSSKKYFFKKNSTTENTQIKVPKTSKNFDL